MSEKLFSNSAVLAIWGGESLLFRRYNYWNRVHPRPDAEPPSETITEVQETLVLLYEGMNDKTRRYIAMDAVRPDQTRGPVLRIEIYNGGYTKDEFTKSYDFPIANDTVNELKRDGMLAGIRHMGYTDDKQLRLSVSSIDRIIDEIEKYEKEHVPEQNND